MRLQGDWSSDVCSSDLRFLWSEFCDWGLEMAKNRLRSENDEERAAAGGTLAWVLERTLRLLHRSEERRVGREGGEQPQRGPQQRERGLDRLSRPGCEEE